MPQNGRKCITCEFFVDEEHKTVTRIVEMEGQRVTYNPNTKASGYCRRNPVPIEVIDFPIEVIDSVNDWCGCWVRDPIAKE